MTNDQKMQDNVEAGQKLKPSEQPVVSPWSLDIGHWSFPTTVLNLGCGRKPIAGALNVDHVPGVGPDLVMDLTTFPWPLPAGHFTAVHAYDVLEHLPDLVATMDEIHRVCRPGARLQVTVPHFSCANAFTDPTHRHYFGLRSFHYFTGENEFGFYTTHHWRTVSARLQFYPSLVNKLVWRLAARYPQAYERRWAWMFPAWFLSFELEAVKMTNDQ